jgi:tRNA (guanine37-N1)-methyltransferase
VWKIEILTIFPGIFESFLKTSLIAKAISRGLLAVTTTDIRSYSAPPHFKVDDSPYGGGAGMVMMVDPLVKAVEDARSRMPLGTKVVLLSPAGTRFNQAKASELSVLDSLIFICGRYEGIDQRVIDLVVDEEISIGDFVVMGGEVPAMLLIEACIRLRPQVVHNRESIEHESFSAALGDGTLIEGPQYSRPDEYRGLKVPEVLLSGDHKAIAKWRLEQAKKRIKD